MFDSNWDLINGQDAHAIEVLNQSSVANVIEALVRYLQHHDPSPGHACELCPNQEILKELHRTGTLLLLRFPGSYRTCDVQVRRRDGQIFYPPAHADVPAQMEAFERDLHARWGLADPVEIAAFALWRINWVHPFKNGNGRTARAFAYACICLKFGAMLPGTSTMIDLITRSREAFEDALAHADASFAHTGAADLLPLRAYLDGLLREQLLSAMAAQAADEAANSSAG